MQTFLPVPSFVESARMLDRQRLGKQRVEVFQILKALTNGGGWSHHPATRMWQQHINALVEYGVVVCEEWISRGYSDTCLQKILAYEEPIIGCVMPDWLGDDRLHASHRSNLLRKDSQFYGAYGWAEPTTLPYYWPTKGATR